MRKLNKRVRALALGACLAGLAMPAAARALPSLPLSHTGRWITDAHGRLQEVRGAGVKASEGRVVY